MFQKRFLFFALILTTTVASAFTFLVPQLWQIEEDYNIRFSTNGAKGIFEKFSGDIFFDSTDLGASRFSVSIEVASINTGIGLKNKHARSKKWFDAARYPYITSVSKNISDADTAYVVTGDLQMHGVTKELSFPFAFTSTETGGVFASHFVVSRSDYGIGKKMCAVGDEIKLEVKGTRP